MKLILLIVTFSMLIGGCSTTPIQINENTTIPQSFENVWYRSTLEKPGFFVMSDTGTLTVNNNSIKFVGDDENLIIKYTDIHSVSFKKLGSDYINNWIVINYNKSSVPAYAVMSSGSYMGWGGGSESIFSMIEFSLKKNNITTIEIKDEVSLK